MEPNPAVAKKDIFDANQTGIVVPVAETPQLIDKQKIVASHREFPKNAILIAIIVLFLLVVIVLVGKLFMSGAGRPKQITLTWWSLEEDADAAIPLVDEYIQKNPNVKINFISQSQQDYRERLVNAIAQGKGPDIYEFHNSWVPMFINNLSPGTSDYSSVFYPVVTNDLKSKNGFLGVPLEYNGIALFVNLDIFQAYGKNPPKTWDDLRRMASDLTIRDANGNIRQSGVALGVTANIDYWQDIMAVLMLQNGANLASPANIQGQSALTFYTNFSKLDHVWDDTLPNSTTYFGNGQVAMYFGTYTDAYKIKKQNPSLHFAVVPLPQLPANGLVVPSISYASYFVNGVLKTSPNSAVAWDFLKFMTTQNSLRELYTNEKKIRGYGNLYPRNDMQTELLSDTLAAPFIYQANFAKSWYLNDKTFDGATGINSQIAKPYADAISTVKSTGTSDKVLNDTQLIITRILASYGLVTAPVATP